MIFYKSIPIVHILTIERSTILINFMFTTPLTAYELMLWPVKLLALWGTIIRGMRSWFFTTRAFPRDPVAGYLAIAACVDSRVSLGYATFVVHWS
jgi:hypothetical protein